MGALTQAGYAQCVKVSVSLTEGRIKVVIGGWIEGWDVAVLWDHGAEEGKGGDGL